MTVTLVYPPSADPTAPYLSVPALTAYLRERGIGVLPIDANLEAWRWMLTPHHLALVNGRVEERLR
ncbi:MAG: B12-binding domain-containing radical SAM protein, partial [Candidatus Eisenbacteria bacterium]|nr:B12-binding domain-containing radical SAM protein [Candidatus Eisenbacteria bacterium]